MQFSTLPAVVLKPGREKPVRLRHPWIFSGAIAESPGAEPGSVIDVRDSRGLFLARGYYNAHSQMRVRILTWSEEEITEDFWRKRVKASLARRTELMAKGESTAFRLIFAESDQMPGVVADWYGSSEDRAGWLVIQSLTAGADAWWDTIPADVADGWQAITGLKVLGIVDRSDEAVRKLEGLEPRSGLVAGDLPGGNTVRIREGRGLFDVDIVEGQKTGFYLDQRENRLEVAELARGSRVLNVFSYTGGFGIHAALAGAAEVIHVDSSKSALDAAQRNATLSGVLGSVPHRFVPADAFELLRQFRDEEERFDLIILDPPKFAHNTGQIDTACRGYKDLNLLSFQLLKPGGWLATFSCSGLVSPDLFQKVVFGAALDARVDAQIAHRFFQSSDHPVLLTFPESLYLKGLLCQRLD